MTFVIYDKRHIVIVDQFSTLRGAKISFTRKGYDPDIYGVTTGRDFYDNVDKDIEVTSLGSGGATKIRASQIGTAEDPSNEKHWFR